MFPTLPLNLECWVTLFRSEMELFGLLMYLSPSFSQLDCLNRYVVVGFFIINMPKFIWGKQTTGSNRTWLPAAREIMRFPLSAQSDFKLSCFFTLSLSVINKLINKSKSVRCHVQVHSRCRAIKFLGTMARISCNETTQNQVSDHVQYLWRHTWIVHMMRIVSTQKHLLTSYTNLTCSDIFGSLPT